MKEFKYVITDKGGIHARPAGALVKEAAAFPCSITIAKDGKAADAKRIFGVMGLGVNAARRSQSAPMERMKRQQVLQSRHF